MSITPPILNVNHVAFPDVGEAIALRDGLVAIGGALTSEWLLAAYPRGIFPWFSDGQPICWWALSPRTVLWPEKLHIGRSLAKTLRNKSYAVTCNQCFSSVIAACAATPRPEQNGTWITQAMQAAYAQLHQLGHVHSFECWYPNEQGELLLTGGLYGVQIGQVFFGESMFAWQSDASKIAFACAIPFLASLGVRLIDCQMDTDHLARFGSENIPFEAFQTALNEFTPQPLRAPIQPQFIHSNRLNKE